MNSSYSWQGGKFYEKDFLIERFPIHSWYVEVFFGSGVLLLNKPKAKREFGNDLFSCLVSFWQCVHNSRLTRKLMKRIELTLDSRYIYQEYMRKDPEQLDLFDRAYRFMFLTTFGFNSYMDTYYTPMTHQLDKIKDHLRVFQNAGKNLMNVHNRIRKVMFTNYDFEVCIKNVKPHPDKFIFLDPPYLGTHQYNRGYYNNKGKGEKKGFFPEENYAKMRDLLAEQHKGGTKFMITCNEINPYFDEMDDIKIEYIKRRACINKNEERKPVRTKVIMNYEVEDVGSCLLMRDDRRQGEMMLV